MMRVYLAEAGRNAHARAALRQGLRAWRRLALLMPVARAACLRHRAAVARLDGRESRAAALLRRAAQQAERCAPAAEAARIRAMAGTNDARSPAAS
jgi:hypothetical protein